MYFKTEILFFSNVAEIPEVPFKQIIGCDGAKEDLQEIVEFLKTPEKFEKFGGKFPKGVLISGPTGTFLFSSLCSSCTKSFSNFSCRLLNPNIFFQLGL